MQPRKKHKIEPRAAVFEQEMLILYDGYYYLYHACCEEVLFTIEALISKHRIKLHSTLTRVKALKSLVRKAEGLGLSDADEAFAQIKDISGIRLICLFLSDIDSVCDLIRDNFEVSYEENKLERNEINHFGYLAIHFICKFKSSNDVQRPEYINVKDIFFEIQVRTILMDAWANISHHLDYKSEIEIPKSLRKDFFALSGLFYVADTHFEMFLKNKTQESNALKKMELSKTLEQEVNYETLNAYLNKRFKNRSRQSSTGLSQLVQELITAGYVTIRDLDDKLKEAHKKFPVRKMSSSLNKVGIIRTSLSSIDAKYHQIYSNSLAMEKPSREGH